MEASRLVNPFLSAPLVGCMTNTEARIVFRFSPFKARRGPRRRCSLSWMQCIRRHDMLENSLERVASYKLLQRMTLAPRVDLAPAVVLTDGGRCCHAGCDVV